MNLPTRTNPFAVPLAGPLGRLLAPLAQWALALPQLNETYRRIGTGRRGLSFVERALDELGVRCDWSAHELSHIPKSGPLVVVANHPFGGVDGLVLAALLQRVRPDAKLLVNRLLRVVPELHETSIFVDAFGGPSAASANAAPLRDALRWLRRGGALGVFPAGEVSHWNLRVQAVRDGPWDATSARLAVRTRSPVVPVFFEGRNSGAFQVGGLLHPRLRTILLPRELLKLRNRRVNARVGSVIPPERLDRFATDGQRTDYLRVRTYILGGRAGRKRQKPAGQPLAQIAAPEAPRQLEPEIDALPAEQRLAGTGDFTVCFARAPQIPAVLREIGRLRETAFRAVGEGTGRARDLDRFDEYYIHLFAWNRARREVVGAYRIGLSDEIIPRFRRPGLYTSTLFRFDHQLLDAIAPAVELGRSFVRPEYQRAFAPLMLLWKGIGLFVARHPRYRRMFGSVSISNEYASLTKQLLVAFLTINNGLPALARLVKPRNPPRFGPGRRFDVMLAGNVARTIEDVDALVAEIESDRRGVPVLLRQYLNLGAKLLAFNVDPDFGDVLDGLMLIDLLDVQPAVLNRYMGRENAAAFRAFHTPPCQSERVGARAEV